MNNLGQPCTEIKLVRYLTLKDAKFLFNVVGGTFSMATQYYYRDLWKKEDSTTGDANECTGDFLEHSHKHYEYLNVSFVSCWSEFSGQKNLNWNLFETTSEVAVLSTNTRVASFITRQFKSQLDRKWLRFREGKVKYYLKGSNPTDYKVEDAVFCKDDTYQEQQEYRFVLEQLPPLPIFQRLTFYTNFNENLASRNESFVEKVYFNLQFLKQNPSQEKREDLEDVCVGLIAERIFKDSIVPEFDEIMRILNKETVGPF